MKKMKITKEQLKQFIKQEYQAVLSERDAIAEGDEHSRTITQIEKIGDEIVRTIKMVADPAVSERLMMIDNMITDLVAKMQGVDSPIGEGKFDHLRRTGSARPQQAQGPAVNPQRKLQYGEQCPQGYKLGYTDYCEKVGASPLDIERAISDIERG
jgi:hypothetical protein